MEKISAVLQQYSIYPQAIVNITDRLYKIKADGKQYALKRSRLETKQLEKWLSVYNFASRKELHAILPAYLTTNKQLYAEGAGEIYYLSPWIEEGFSDFSQNSLDNFYKMLGKIHVQTKQHYKINKRSIEENFTAYKNNCSADEKALLTIIETIETRNYPSPFELQVLTHYRDLSYALKQSQQLVETIVSLTADTSEWSTSLVHGNLGKSHIFERYLINWEQACYKHAFQDLSDFFHKEAGIGQRNIDIFIQSFPEYLEENPFTDIELAMLKLYLLNTSEYIDLLERRRASQHNNQSTIEQTIELEKSYRRILFGLNFNETITISDSTNSIEKD